MLLATYRKEAASSLINYLGDSTEAQSPEILINAINFSEVICTRINLKVDVNSAVGYLVGCYRRLSSKENLILPAIAEEFNRFVIVSFIIPCNHAFLVAKSS